MPYQRLSTLLCSAVLAASPAFAAGKKFTWTYPMPPRAKPTDPMTVTVAKHIPEFPERYTWKTVAPSYAKAAADVRVFSFGRDGQPVALGAIPLATAITFETFRFFGGFYYYSIPWPLGAQPAAGVPPTLAWVRGDHIAPASYTPPDQ